MRAACCPSFGDLDRVDVLDQRAEHRRLVAAAGADLQHLVGRLRIDRFGHVGHDERRRNGLAFADRQGHVEIGIAALGDRHELVPRRGAHGLDHPRILHARADDLLVDHVPPGQIILARRAGRRLGRGLSSQKAT